MWPSHLVKCRIPLKVQWWHVESFWLFHGMPVASNVEVMPSTFKIRTLNKAFETPLLTASASEIVSLVKQYQPICTIRLYLNIFRAFDLSNPDHCLFFTPQSSVQNLGSFSPDIHLSLAVNAMDSCVSPTCLHVYLKASKTDPFRKGCLIHIGRSNTLRCATSVLLIREKGPIPQKAW